MRRQRNSWTTRASPVPGTVVGTPVQEGRAVMHSASIVQGTSRLPSETHTRKSPPEASQNVSCLPAG